MPPATRIDGTPERRASVWIASAALLLAGAFAVLGARPGRTARVCRHAFVATVVFFFVLVFGVAEGLSTHVVYPALQGGYGAEEPFDALFQVTGVLQVIPAVVVTALLLPGMRSVGRTATNGQWTPRRPARTHGQRVLDIEQGAPALTAGPSQAPAQANPIPPSTAVQRRGPSVMSQLLPRSSDTYVIDTYQARR